MGDHRIVAVRTSGDGIVERHGIRLPALLANKFASWEVVYMVALRVLALSIICIAVAVVAWFAYTAAKDSEIRTFLVEYEAVVETAKQRLQAGLDSKLHAAEAAAAVFSLVEGDLRIRNFWEYADGAVETASLRAIAFVPLVRINNQSDFLAAVNASQGFLFPNAGRLASTLQDRFARGQITAIAGASAAPPSALAGLVAPVLQISPLANFYQNVLEDLSSEPLRAAAIAAAFGGAAPACSDVFQLAQDTGLSTKRPSSLVVSPVNMSSSAAAASAPAALVGALAAAFFSWDEMLQGVVPHYLGGLGVELRGPLNRTTVIEVAGDSLVVGFDDSVRDRTLERYRRTFTISSGRPGAQTSFTVDVYPKASFLNWFLSNRPRDTAIGVISIVFGIGIIVTIYDVLGRLRLRTMTALAARQLKKFIVKPAELLLPPMRKVALVTAGVTAGKTGARVARKSQTELVGPPFTVTPGGPGAAKAVTGKRLERHLSKHQGGSNREHGPAAVEEALLKAQFVLFRGTPCVLIPILLGDDAKTRSSLQGQNARMSTAVEELTATAFRTNPTAARISGTSVTGAGGGRHGGDDGDGSLSPALRMGKFGKEAGLWGIAPGRFSRMYAEQGDHSTVNVDGVDLHRFAMRGESVKTFARAPKEWVQESNLMELCNLRHPQVATTFGASVVSGIIVAVQEYCSMGSLHSLLNSAVGDLELPELSKIAVGVVTGCRYLHESQPPVVVNLSTQRILIDSSFSPKVQVPFRIVTHDVSQSMDEWTAPEILEGGMPSLQSDVYTIGVLFYRLFADDKTFGRSDTPPLPEEVQDRIRNWRKGKKHTTPELIDVLRDVSSACCNIRDPGGRPALSTVDGLVNTTLSEAAAVKADTARSDTEMLSQMMPKHVTDALKAGKKVEPELFEEITVFFSDIVGYTDISSTLPAEHVANMLDRLYEAFDRLALKHGLFKAETIGDAYMAMGGVPEFQPDHTLRVATFAAEAVATANRIPIDPADPSKGMLNIRVGFHTGPAVACVVGTLRPKYCLYGDTINTASRMESMSEPNRINMSQTAREALADQAPNARVRDRGQITVKGKGTMQCFFLETEPDPVNGARLVLAADEDEDDPGTRDESLGGLRHDLPQRDDHLASTSMRRAGSGAQQEGSRHATPKPDQLMTRLGSRFESMLGAGGKGAAGGSLRPEGGAAANRNSMRDRLTDDGSARDTPAKQPKRWSEDSDVRRMASHVPSPLSKV